MAYRLNTADLPGPVRLNRGVWQRLKLPDTLGACTNDICQVDDGLLLAYTHYHPQRDLLETSAIDRDSRVLTIAMALEGASSNVGINGQRFDFIAGHSTVAAFSSVKGERRFPAHQTIRQLRLVISESLLQRYQLEHLTAAVGQDSLAHPIACDRHNSAAQQLAATLVHLHDRNAGVLDLQVAALSLLAEQTRRFLPDCRHSSRLQAEDEARVRQARDILIAEFARPLTLAYLCTVTGTNEFKLKQGFRELYGTSPHRMLTDIRMKKAWELLETGARVSTAGYQVGYQHLSSFSAAFERYYGRAPKSVARLGRAEQ